MLMFCARAAAVTVFGVAIRADPYAIYTYCLSQAHLRCSGDVSVQDKWDTK